MGDVDLAFSLDVSRGRQSAYLHGPSTWRKASARDSKACAFRVAIPAQEVLFMQLNQIATHHQPCSSAFTLLQQHPPQWSRHQRLRGPM